MCALYAFLRRTDDLADEPGSVPEKIRALQDWRLELDSALAGRATAWPGLLALADTVARHGIPPHLLCGVIEGVSSDVVPRRFANFDELAAYCYQVASVVGLSCLHIWGFCSGGGQAERFAEHCGIALQLTNIIRDVREDAREGRIYLPEDDLANFGVAAEELSAAGRPSERVRALLAFEGERAYGFYRAAPRLAPLLAPVGRPVFRAIIGIYQALLDEMARRDYNVLDGKIALSPWRKISIALRALAPRSAASDLHLTGAADPPAWRDAIVRPR
jgi:phytoene synthase